MKNFILILAVTLVFGTGVFGQGSISGTITDANGKPIAAATVKAYTPDHKNPSVTTDENGAYEFDGIAPGKYALSVTANGFDVVTKGEIVVTDGDDTTVDLTLAASPVRLITSVAPIPKGYVPGMTALFAEMNRPESKTLNFYVEISQKFAQLGDEEKTEWLPYYYAALNLATVALIGHGDVDGIADKGMALLDKAEARSKDNSEVYVLRAQIMTAQEMVDPQSRWSQFGQRANAYLETAKKLDPNNPRVYLVICSSTYRTPEPFGGGMAKALPICREAMRKFEAFKPQNSFSPNWGRESVEMYMR